MPIEVDFDELLMRLGGYRSEEINDYKGNCNIRSGRKMFEITDRDNMELRDESWRKDLKKSMTAKERTCIERIHMPEVDPAIRIQSNVEVNKGITAEMAIKEAKRCLDCADPACMKGCPVDVDIPTFIKYVEAGEFLKGCGIHKKEQRFPIDMRQGLSAGSAM